jgi:hypothetical protein
MIASTIRFQKIVQFIQVIHFQLAYRLELFDYLLHQLILTEIFFELRRVVLLGFGGKVISNNLINLISFADLSLDLVNNALVAAYVVELRAMLHEFLFIRPSEGNVFLFDSAVVVVPLIVGDV